MTRCTQPGCAGIVEEDGFCGVCGMAPLPPSPPSAPPAGPPAGPSALPPVVPLPAGPSLGPSVGAAVTTPSAVPASPAHAGPSAQAGPDSGPGSGRTGSGRTASRGTRGTGSGESARRGLLGAGLVEVPPVPYRDPASAIMADPEVPEKRRFCSRCDEPVGRSRDGRPGRTEGFCRNCGHPFSFTPKLQAGELIGGQYEVLGCLAHGGLGWVYLARDHNVSDRWVVLKGLLDTGDTDSMAAATAERAFLAEVEHPNIVKIYNFVRHGGSGYIVMEYVGGQSLKDILLRLRTEHGEDAALPLGQVIAYGLEVLRALGYLHGVGLLYCDFKPDNAIQSEEQLKLIDLGGVRRSFDVNSPIFGTPGYQAPEISEQGPSVTSDLYTVGRTLAVLSFPFRGYTRRHLRSLPPRGEVPLLARHESYYRLLRRATHPDPAQRFQSAAEMAEQLTGVLREVLSAEDDRPRPAPSPLFGPEQNAAGTEVVGAGTLGSATARSGPSVPVLVPLEPAAAAAALPVPLVHGSDPAAAFLGGLNSRDPRDLAGALGGAPLSSPEVRLALVRVRIELGELEAAGRLLDEIGTDRPDDWRVDWYRGVAALAAGRGADAASIFDSLYDLMPGESAPKLALAFCHECRGDALAADRFHETVWRTDPAHVSAAFGLARARLAARDPAAAERVLDSVPRISSHYVAAQLAAVAAAVRARDPEELTAATLVAAGRRLEALPLDRGRFAAFSAEVLESALAWMGTRDGVGGALVPARAPSRNATDPGHVSGAGAGGDELFGTPMREPLIRARLEKTYRLLAKLADGADHRHAMVRRANSVRPRTLF